MPASQLKFILNEIISTEETYLNSLITLQEKFIEPLQKLDESNPKLKKNKDLQEFLKATGNLKSIIALSQKMLEELKKAKVEGDSVEEYATKIEKVLLKHADFLKLYAQYIVPYNDIIQLMPKIMNIKEISELSNKFKMVTSTEKGQGQDPLASFILPVQRIPRYNLLLKDVLKKSKNASSNFPLILQKTESIAASINASMHSSIKSSGYDITNGKVSFSWQDRTKSKTFNPSHLKTEALQEALIKRFGFAAVAHKSHLNHKLYVAVTVKDPKTGQKEEVKFKIIKEKTDKVEDNQFFAVKIKKDLLSLKPGDRQRFYDIAEKIGKSVIDATKTKDTISFEGTAGVGIMVKDTNTSKTKTLQKEDIDIPTKLKVSKPKN